MLYDATFRYKTQNMQIKDHIMGETTSPSKLFRIIGVLKAYFISSIQCPIYHLQKI